MTFKEIYTSKPFLPSIEEYTSYVQSAFLNGTLTNNGILLQELEKKLKEYLGVYDIQVVTNGTVALQLAIKALNIRFGEIITTPFSYVATTSAILTENCEPVYVDIESDNFTIDADKIEQAITPRTRAIMPVHIFGYACNIEKIQEIAQKHNLKVIYDAAHAFGAEYNGQSILNYGDVSILSFQESKLFHSAEGGALVTKDNYLASQIELLKKCGHIDDNYIRDGINARFSELHSAMGLASFNYIDEVIFKRNQLCETYDYYLSEKVKLPKKQVGLNYKYPYYVIVLNSQEQMRKILDVLCQNKIYPWNCYSPSLNKLKYLKSYQPCPIAEDISSRILMLPLYYDLSVSDVERICSIIIANLG